MAPRARVSSTVRPETDTALGVWSAPMPLTVKALAGGGPELVLPGFGGSGQVAKGRRHCAGAGPPDSPCSGSTVSFQVSVSAVPFTAALSRAGAVESVFTNQFFQPPTRLPARSWIALVPPPAFDGS